MGGSWSKDGFHDATLTQRPCPRCVPAPAEETTVQRRHKTASQQWYIDLATPNEQVVHKSVYLTYDTDDTWNEYGSGSRAVSMVNWEDTPGERYSVDSWYDLGDGYIRKWTPVTATWGFTPSPDDPITAVRADMLSSSTRRPQRTLLISGGALRLL